MARPIILTVGPLIASSATKIAASQKAAGAQLLVLNGGGGTAVANNIALSQTPTGAGNLTLNGSLAVGSPAVAYLGANSYIYITDVGNDSGVTFTITGLVASVSGLTAQSETITGANASVVSSAKQYYQISQIAVSTGTAGAVTVGTYAPVVLDTPRQILFTDGGNDTGITFTISGLDWAGSAITEAVTGASGATAPSVLSYGTINTIKTSGAVATTITVGTNGVAYSPWSNFDWYAGMGPTAIQVNGTGTVNWTIQQTLDDPTAYGSPIYGTPQSMNWVNHPDINLVSSTTISGVQGNYAYPPKFARILLNSGTGSVNATFLQNYQK